VRQWSEFVTYTHATRLLLRYAKTLLMHINTVCIDFQVHRRFQVTFMSSSAVLEFIDAIRTICPCKANPISVPAPAAPALARPGDTTTAMRTFKTPLDARPTPTPAITAEQMPNLDNLPVGPPSSLGPPAFPPRRIQEPIHGLQIPFSSSQGFALTSEPNVYSSSPLRGLV
jgi:hypothetical protein